MFDEEESMLNKRYESVEFTGKRKKMPFSIIRRDQL